MKKCKIIRIMLFLGVCSQAQTAYVDVLTAPAMMTYSANLKSEQKKTVKELNGLKEAQVFISAQMVTANHLQNAIYNGLREVNGTLQNGLQVQRIYKSLENITKNIDEIIKEASNRPEYVVFAASATRTTARKVVDVGTEVAELLQSGDLNLATAGDRRRLLGSIELNLSTLNVYLINIRLSIRRAKRKGWWKSINPFQEYVNIDKMLINQIVRNSKRLKTW